MTHLLYKRLGLLSIKYMPSILALVCSVKIMLLTASDIYKDTYMYVVHWINWFFSLTVLAGIYCLGRALGYCWKHQSLCRLTLWGFIYYAYFLVMQVPKSETRPLTYIYVAAVLIYTMLYKELK